MSSSGSSKEKKEKKKTTFEKFINTKYPVSISKLYIFCIYTILHVYISLDFYIFIFHWINLTMTD
jgi:hypothetical protein